MIMNVIVRWMFALAPLCLVLTGCSNPTLIPYRSNLNSLAALSELAYLTPSSSQTGSVDEEKAPSTNSSFASNTDVLGTYTIYDVFQISLACIHFPWSPKPIAYCS